MLELGGGDHSGPRVSDLEATCSACGQDVPSTRFCIRCGTAFVENDALRSRRRFAASPNERKLSPRVTSSLFPQLPRAAMRTFRGVFLIAIGGVIALGLASLFPLAIAIAAVIVPVLTVVYLVDVDIYEDHPLRVIGLTVAWGAVAGVAVGLIARTSSPSGADLLSRSIRESLLIEGVALPLLGLVLAVLGPLFLLRNRRFDDVLDGTTFGSVSAVWLSAAALLTSSSLLFADGIRPGGSPLEWVARLLQLAVAGPLLWAGVVGAATGSIWLRYRAPAAHRKALGLLGQPAVALTLAALVVVASAFAQLTLPVLGALAVMLGLAGTALVWLRHAIHVGLVHESTTIPVGATITCANCGCSTPQHTFCCECGISFRALPKTRAQQARLRDPIVMGGFSGIVLALVGVAFLTIEVASRDAPSPLCFPGGPCGGPPSSSPPIREGATWVSESGVQVEYDLGQWAAVEEENRVTFENTDKTVWLELVTASEPGARTSETEIPERLGEKLKAIEPLGIPMHAPGIGYVKGTGGWQTGYLDSPQGPRETVTIASLAAKQRGVTVAMTAIFLTSGDETLSPAGRGLRSDVDSMLNTVTWRAAAQTIATRRGRDRRIEPAAATAEFTPMPPNEKLDFSVALVVPRATELRRYARDVTDPASPRYRRYLSASAAGRRFGLPRASIAHLVQRLEREGLEVTAQYAQRTGLRLRGCTADINRLFQTVIREFVGRDGRRHHAPARLPIIPHPLQDVIASVHGLDTRPEQQPSPAALRGGLRPADVAQAYEIGPLWRRGIRGRGETIAIVSMDTFREVDIETYDRLVGVEGAPAVERVQVLEPVTLDSGALEVSLDIEVIRAIAPEATIVNYEAPRTWPGFVEALRRINADGRASIVSVSWGKCVDRVPMDIRAAMEREHEVAVAAGRTNFVASGDSGAYSCLHSETELDPENHAESVDWPAASPHVVAVGGTRLIVRQDGSYFAEAGWEDVLSNRGSGGGISAVHQRPRWQRGRGVENRFSTGKRQVPDVAGPADCDSAFLIVYPQQTESGWKQVVGPAGCGTSAAAPFWAGVAALVRQYVRSRGRPDPGFLAPVFYDLARSGRKSPFYDVQAGGNLKHEATRGWDYATGLGSPKAWDLARALATGGR